MKYYAYVPTEEGEEPMGTANRIKFQLKTNRGAIRRAKRVLGDNFCLFTYTNFYNDLTFKEIII